MKLIRILDLERKRVIEGAGQAVVHDERPVYVREFHPDGFGGNGHLLTTQDPRRAKRFGSLEEAMVYYSQRSKLRPMKDGRPNCPLLALNVQVVDTP